MQDKEIPVPILRNCAGEQCCGSIIFWFDPDPIRGPMPLTNGSGSGSGFESGSCYFRHWPSWSQQKTNSLKDFQLISFQRYILHHFSQIKSQKEVTKQEESRFFLLFLLDDRRIRIRVQEAKKHADPDPDSYPDPQHCRWVYQSVHI